MAMTRPARRPAVQEGLARLPLAAAPVRALQAAQRPARAQALATVARPGRVAQPVRALVTMARLVKTWTAPVPVMLAQPAAAEGGGVVVVAAPATLQLAAALLQVRAVVRRA